MNLPYEILDIAFFIFLIVFVLYHISYEINKTVLKVVYVKSLYIYYICLHIYICSQYSPLKINYSGMGF